MKPFKLIRCGAGAAGFNMAFDEHMYRQYLIDGIGRFRVYHWKRPSFTFGFSQDVSRLIDWDYCQTHGVDFAKRITGGGILFHDDEITYSFVCSKEDVGEPGNILVSYKEICAFLVKFYKSFGLNPVFARDLLNFASESSSEFCSSSNEKYDITINRKKIGGNAQKRSRQAVFQHGSIPIRLNWVLMKKCLKASAKIADKKVTTLSDELNFIPGKDTLKEKLIDAFQDTFKIKFYETCLA